MWKAQLEQPALLREERAGTAAGGRRARGTSLPGGLAPPQGAGKAISPSPSSQLLCRPRQENARRSSRHHPAGRGHFPQAARTAAAPRRYRLPQASKMAALAEGREEGAGRGGKGRAGGAERGRGRRGEAGPHRRR